MRRHHDWTLRDGSTVKLLLTAQARADAEAAIGTSVTDFLLSRSTSDKCLAAVLQAAMAAARRRDGNRAPVALADAFALIDSEGLIAAARAVCDAYAAATTDPDAPPAATGDPPGKA